MISNAINNCLDDTHTRGLIWKGEVVHRFGLNLAHNAAGVARAERLMPAVGSRMSYHFVIGPDGFTEQALPLDVIGWHARSWSRTRIGIACLGDFRREPMPDPQWFALVDLLAMCSAAKGKIAVAYHDRLPKSSKDPGKQCPGDALPYDRLIDAIGAKMRDTGLSTLAAMGVVLGG